jgi:hypothetical protein
MTTFDSARRARTMTAACIAAPSAPTGRQAMGPILSLVPLSERPDGARLALSPCSPLVVGIAPLREIDRLRAEPALKRVVTYGLIHRGEALGEQPEIRWGETVLVPKRLNSHRADPPLPIEEVVLIGSAEPRAFGESALLALQEALTHQAQSAGRARVVGAEPQKAWLGAVDPALIARWLTDLRRMLVMLGCPYLETRGPVLAPRAERLPVGLARAAIIEPAPAPAVIERIPAETVSMGYTLDLPAGLAARADAALYSLTWRGLHASVVVANGWTVLRAGSYLSARDRLGIQDCLSRKRQALRRAGLAKPTRDGRLRLRCDIGLPSLVNATRVVTGGNEGNNLWARL